VTGSPHVAAKAIHQAEDIALLWRQGRFVHRGRFRLDARLRGRCHVGRRLWHELLDRSEGEACRYTDGARPLDACPHPNAL
jgi:hypothetical protein